MRVVLIAFVAAAVAGCSRTPPVPSASQSSPSAPATAASTAAAITLPDPGGTCDAANFIAAASPTNVPTPAAMGTAQVVITAPFRNTGAACELAQPYVIGIGSRNGALERLSVPNLGQYTCAGNECETTYPTEYAVEPEDTVTITIKAWWWLRSAEPPTTPRPCEAPVADVSSAAVPFATGRLTISLDPALEMVCSSPETVGLRIEVS